MEKKLREAGEDYLETILKLARDNDQVRSIDVAIMLGVSRPSVNKAVGVLKEMGMVEQQPYGSITLTQKGREHAAAVTERHLVIKAFLRNVLEVEEETAEEDACRMEHVVSLQTMQKLAAFVKNNGIIF